MSVERTLSIVKPDGVQGKHIGEIFRRFEAAGLRIIATKMTHLSRRQAEEFYYVHKERSFFKELVEYMVSGPVVISVLEGDGAIAKNRALMGATDPKKADKGTIRADMGKDIGTNTVHGSDAPDTAKFEIGHFFSGCELFPL